MLDEQWRKLEPHADVLTEPFTHTVKELLAIVAGTAKDFKVRHMSATCTVKAL